MSSSADAGASRRSAIWIGSRLRAAVYAEIKPQHNSFVYDLEHDPGIFLYVDPDVGRTQFTYTVAHELHHVGFAQNCPTPAVRAEIERLAPPRADFHDARHVHLVEGGEHGGGALGFHQPAGDGLASARHAHVLFGALAIDRRLCCRLGSGLRRTRAWLDKAFDVLAGDTPTGTGAFDA